MFTLADLKTISKLKSPPAANVQSLFDALISQSVGLDQMHRACLFNAMTYHETGGLKWNKEIWGPTPSQKRYEGRKDLGNTQKGDGSKFRGYGLGQLTGRGNVTKFWKWCVKSGLNPPDFVKSPQLIATGMWSGLSAIWFWDEGNQTGKSLNTYADENNIEMITRIWNGGLNGYEDRLDYYDRSALVALGYAPTDIIGFQRDAVKAGEKLGTSGKTKNGVDGVSGPRTRALLHKNLLRMTDRKELSSKVQAAPVVVETVQAVAVKTPSAKTPWYLSKEFLAPLITGGGLTAGATMLEKFGSIPWENLLVLCVFGFAALMTVLMIQRYRDHQKQEIIAKEIEG